MSGAIILRKFLDGMFLRWVSTPLCVAVRVPRAARTYVAGMYAVATRAIITGGHSK